MISYSHAGALALGLVVQAFIMLFGKWQKGDFKKVILSLATGLLGMLPGKNERDYDVRLHIFMSLVVAAFSFTAAFASRLVSRIGARTLIVANAMVVLIVFDKFGYSETIFYILLVPTLITLINGFTNLDRHFVAQVFFYLWFCTMLFTIGLIQFAFGDMLNIMGWGDSAHLPSFLSTFFMGAALMYILSNVWFVLYMIPFTDKHQTLEDRMNKIKIHMQRLAFGYIWQKDDTVGNIITVIVLPIALFANHIYGWIDLNTLIFIVLALIPFTVRPAVGEAPLDDGIGTLEPQI